MERELQPGIYKELIESAQHQGSEYSKIWDLFAFQEWFTPASFPLHGRGSAPASFDQSQAIRELIAASTSFLEQMLLPYVMPTPRPGHSCWLFFWVWNALENVELERQGALAFHQAKVTTNLPGIGKRDVEAVRTAGLGR